MTPPAIRAAFLLLATVLIPPADHPRLQWIVRNATTNVTHTFEGTASMNVKHGTLFRITLNVIDPQGVHKITLGGEATWTCRSGNIGQQRNATEATQAQTLHPDANGNVLTKIFLLRDSNSMPCSNGFHFVSGSETLAGTGENYRHVTTKATLTLNATP